MGDSVLLFFVLFCLYFKKLLEIRNVKEQKILAYLVMLSKMLIFYCINVKQTYIEI